ncbi:MAG: hypothetical protein Q9184_008252 [Pyrenodesmia sp. 2 TL-2023]
MPPTPISTLRHCTDCNTKDPSLLKPMFFRAIGNHETSESHLVLLICGVTAIVLTTGAVAALLSRLLYRRLKETRRQRSLGLFPGLPLVDNLGGRGRDEENRRKDENIKRDVELQNPLFNELSGGVERGVEYVEVEEEGVGVHFLDVDLGNDTSYGRRSKNRSPPRIAHIVERVGSSIAIAVYLQKQQPSAKIPVSNLVTYYFNMATSDQVQAALCWAIITAIATMVLSSVWTLFWLFGAAEFGWLSLNFIITPVIYVLAIQSALLIRATYLVHSLRPNEGWVSAVPWSLFPMPPGGDAWEGGFWHREVDEVDVEKALEMKSSEFSEKEVLV